MTTPRRALLPPPRLLGQLHEAAVVLLLPRHVPTPNLAPPRHWHGRPESLDQGLVGLGLAERDYVRARATVAPAAGPDVESIRAERAVDGVAHDDDKRHNARGGDRL